MNEFRKKALELHTRMNDLLKKAEGEARGLTEDERTEYDGWKEQRDQFLTLAEEREAQEKLDAQFAEPATRSVGPEGGLESGAAGGTQVRVGADREAEQPFAHFGEQLHAVVRAALPDGGEVDKRLLHLNSLETRAATGLGESNPADGGFLVQKDFNDELLKKTYEIGQISSRVKRIPIGAGKNGLKMNAVDETSRADGSRWGGIRAYWAAEAEAFTASKPKFRQMEMNLHKLIALLYATDELLEDATALGAVISEGFPEEMNFKVENAIINGTGAGQPAGILNAGCLVSVDKETGQTADTIVYKNLTNMWARAWGRGRVNGIWTINQDVEPVLMDMGITIGTGGTPVYMPPGGLSQSPYSTLFGRPVIPVEYNATVGTVGDIQFLQMAEYLMIDKGSIKSASSIHVRFVYGETAFRFTYRVDGQPTWNSALTPFKGSNTLSPFVALASRD